MGPTWGGEDPGGPHVGHVNRAIWVDYSIPTSVSNVNELSNNALDEINDRLSENKLTLDIEKNTFMVFHPYQKDMIGLIAVLKINDIEHVRVFKMPLDFF